MIRFNHKGGFEKTFRFLKNTKKINKYDLDKFGKDGVTALSISTPKDTWGTASSWSYEITDNSRGTVSISFNNSNIQNGVPIAIILQFGHGTRNGGWVQGRDYINPAIQPIFDNIAESAWREVTNR